MKTKKKKKRKTDASTTSRTVTDYDATVDALICWNFGIDIKLPWNGCVYLYASLLFDSIHRMHMRHSILLTAIVIGIAIAYMNWILTKRFNIISIIKLWEQHEKEIIKKFLNQCRHFADVKTHITRRNRSFELAWLVNQLICL